MCVRVWLWMVDLFFVWHRNKQGGGLRGVSQRQLQLAPGYVLVCLDLLNKRLFIVRFKDSFQHTRTDIYVKYCSTLTGQRLDLECRRRFKQFGTIYSLFNHTVISFTKDWILEWQRITEAEENGVSDFHFSRTSSVPRLFITYMIFLIYCLFLNKTISILRMKPFVSANDMA